MTLRTKLTTASGIALFILATISLQSFRWILRADENERWLAHTHAVLAKLDAVVADVLSAETEQHGYRLMGDVSYQHAYEEALQDLQSDVSELHKLTADNPRQQQALGQLDPLVSKKIAELKESVGVQWPRDTSAQPVRTQTSTTQEIRSVITAMKSEEERLLSERSEAAHTSSRWMKVVLVLGSTLAVLFLASAALIMYQELGKRDKAEQLLRQSEERLGLMAARVKEYAIFMLDPDGHVASWNEGAERIKGYRAEEIIGQHFSRFYPPKDVAQGKPERELTIAASEGQFEDDGWRVRKDGSRFWANVVITAIRDEKGVLRGFAKVSRDLTERRRAEQEIEHQNALLTAANKELDAFSYSVAHDLRAPLRIIDGFSQALLQDYQDQIPPEGKLYLERMRAGVLRMAQLIDDLLNLARISRQQIERTEVDLSALAEEVAAQLQASSEGRTAHFSIAPDMRVTADRSLLRIVLDNLLGNAWKFTSKQQDTKIEFGMQSGDGERVFFVRDNGSGFDMNYADKLFGVFQRLHRDSEFPGTGVGLATVQRIIHRHGGRIWASAAVGKGATFFFVL